MSALVIYENDGTVSYLIGPTPITTPLPIDFPWFFTNEIAVFKVVVSDPPVPELRLIEGFDYNLVGVPADDGFWSGSITLLEPHVNCTIRIDRVLRTDKSSNFPETGAISIPGMNTLFSRLFSLIQDLLRRISLLEAGLTPGVDIALPLHTYIGTGTWQIDTPAIEQAIRAAAADNGARLWLVGDIQIGWSDATPDYFQWHCPERPVIIAVHLDVDNIVVDGSDAVIRFAAPPPYVSTQAFTTGIRPMFVAFGTLEHHAPRTLRNIEFRGCNFDLGFQPGATGGCGRALSIVGADHVRLTRNNMYNAWKEPVTVTLADDGVGKVNVIWPGHHLDMGPGSRCIVRFKGALPPTMVEGYEYYGTVIDDNALHIAEIDGGPFVAMSGPSVSPTAEGVHIGAAAGYQVDNCDDSFFLGNSFRYVNQGYFSCYCRNAHWENEEFIQFSEAIDIQETLQGGSFKACTFLRSYGTGQCLDLACPRSVLIANNLFDSVRTPYQIYTKLMSTGHYERLASFGFPAFVQFIPGTPGKVQMDPSYTSLANGMRVMFEYRPKPERTPTDPAPPLFPGETFDTTVGPHHDGTLHRYVNYHVRNWDAATSTFSVELENQVDAVGVVIPLPPGAVPTSAMTGTIALPPTASGGLINFPNAGSPNCQMIVLPASPADVLPAFDCTATGNIGTNLRTDDPPDPDDETANDIEIVGGRVFMLGVQRELNRGLDRKQHLNGTPTQCRNIRLYGNSFDGGRVCWFFECANLEVDGLWLNRLNPAADASGVAQPALKIEIGLTTTAVAQGLISGSMRNVHIIDCRAQPFIIRATSDFTIDDFETDGFNLDHYTPTLGGNITRHTTQGGHKQIGRLSMKRGEPGTKTSFTAASWAAGNVTGTTAIAHSVAVGGLFRVDNATPAGYNGWKTAIAGTAGSTLVWTQSDPGGAMIVPMGQLLLPGTDLDLRDLTTTPAGVSRLTINGPITLSSANFRGLLCDAPTIISQREQVTLPPIATTGATITVPIRRNNLTPIRVLACSLSSPTAMLAGGANCSQVQLMKSTTAGASLAVSTILSVDAAARAINEDIALAINSAGSSTTPDVAATDTMLLQFTKLGTGSTLPWMMVRWYGIPYSQGIA